jgi:hypothetical protein
VHTPGKVVHVAARWSEAEMGRWSFTGAPRGSNEEDGKGVVFGIIC